MQNEFSYAIEVMSSLLVPATLSNGAHNASNLFDRETDTIWSPTATDSSTYTVVIKTPQSPMFRGVTYYAYGDETHDAQKLEVSSSSDALTWQTQTFTLKSGIQTAQTFNFRNRAYAMYWRFRMEKMPSSSEPLWLREINMVWSVSAPDHIFLVRVLRPDFWHRTHMLYVCM